MHCSYRFVMNRKIRNPGLSCFSLACCVKILIHYFYFLMVVDTFEQRNFTEIKTGFMKKVLLFLILFCSYFGLQAQEKYDTIYMKNGDVNIGSISAINDQTVTFNYKGETLSYNFKTSDISKIVFLSGRVQNFGSPAPSQTQNASPAAGVDHHNKVAVLPFGYITTQQETNSEMGYKVQTECYTYLSNKAGSMEIQDPSTTNAFLGKAGINVESLRNYTNTELCNLLGVEYIVRGTVTSNLASTTTSGSATYDEKNKNASNDKSGNTSGKTSGSVYTSGSTQQNFKTEVLLEIYQDNGKKIFGQDRTSFWSSADAYKSTIQFLLKKSPLYGR